MASFLTLPRELRDLVYLAVLSSPDPAPKSPQEASRDREQISASAETSFFESCTDYPSKVIPASSSGLILTCRQVHEETQAAIATLKAKDELWYHLDCMIQDERRLYPTWLLIPAVTSDIDLATVDFRLFGDRGGDRSAFADTGSGPSLMVWSLLSLLYRFLDCGPDFLSKSKIGRKVIVGVLVLNVVSCPKPKGGFIPIDGSRSVTITHGLIHPEGVVSMIHSALNLLLERTYLTSRYASVVYEQVRVVRLTLDGKIRAEWDLAAIDAKGTAHP